MLRVLRQLTPEELRLITHLCGARPGAAPEEIVRNLARVCGIYAWGIFPITSEDMLLDHLGRRLGMEPLYGNVHALPLRERMIFAHYVRQAWSAALPEQRVALLERALAAWDSSALPCPALAANVEYAQVHPTLEALLQQPAGCRALATALDSVPLALPATAGQPSSPFATMIRPSLGHDVVYGVLAVLWRARARILKERRLQRTHLERQLRQTGAMLDVRRKNVGESPRGWALNPRSGLALTTGAAAALAAQFVLQAGTPLTMPSITLVGLGGLLWAVIAAARAAGASGDERVARMQTQVWNFRNQLGQLDREILALESE